MRRVAYKLLFCMALAVAVLRSQPVRADFDLVLPSAVIPLQTTNWNQFVTIPKFDPTLGELIMVLVKITPFFEASIIAENTSPSPSTLTAVATVVVTPSPSPPVVWNLGPMQGNFNSSIPVAPSDGPGFTGPDTAFFDLNGSLMVQRNFSLPADLTHFTEDFPGDTWSVPATGNGSFTVTSDTGNANVMGTTRAGLQVDVTYRYIPEPATLAMLAMGLFGVSWRRRSR